ADPLSAGAVQLTVACALPGTADCPVGAAGGDTAAATVSILSVD
ncbi:MAG: hypothetical protein QOI08_213, partial [Actinomycetota bacterium]|nr:hypothetical protein [Actinomycetota bacterium]